ncbi:C39 family peptidase [uncultured Adlercreutzia sp.]|uniref:C39 family peptidase n=1 Tax=uncultured Adlercreutzia sp. TaxID=875803 RepID=UPI0025DD8210|nr:C39 family peptidase [uncultured Adlercreutzia sp.]
MGNEPFTQNPFSRERWSRPGAPDVTARCAAVSGPVGGGSGEAVPFAVRDSRRRDGRSVPTRRRPAWELPGKPAAFVRRGTCSAMASLRLMPWVAAVGLAVFLLVAALGGVRGLLTAEEPATLASAPLPQAGAAQEAQPISTPRDQWQRGTMPYLYQIDPQWGSAPYAGADMANSGCGPTSLAMVYVALTGKTDYDPPAMGVFSEENGYVEEGLTSWLLMSEGAAQLGLASRELPADVATVIAALEAGEPVICTVGPGDFTTTGHFIVLSGVDETGDFVVHDPNSAQNSARTWDAQRVLDQCRNLWAFRRA